MAVLLNSFTPIREHAYEIDTGIMAIVKGETPEIGVPVPTVIDIGQGVLSLCLVVLGVRDVLRSPVWVDKRRPFPLWRFALRLLPQLIVPVFAGWLFLVVPTLQDNSITTADVLGLYPAAMILIMVGALVGLGLTTARIAVRSGRRG